MAFTDLLGSVATAIPDVINSFNYKAQENEILLAEQQARLAEAQAKMSPTASAKPWMWIGIALAVIVLLIILFKRN